MTTATSPYAPTRRQSFASVGSQSSSSIGTGKSRGLCVISLVWFILHFWRGKLGQLAVVQRLQTHLERLHVVASVALRPVLYILIQWTKTLHLKLLVHASLTPRPQTECKKTVESRNLKERIVENDQQLLEEHSMHGVSPEANNLHRTKEQLVLLQRFRENKTLIDDILHFWFGQYVPDQSQKKLWMISEQTIAYRQRIDQRIASDYTGILKQLLGRERWGQWCEEADLYGWRGKLASIIVLDQFSRHIHRYFVENNIQTKDCLAEQSVMDSMAFQTAKILVQEHHMEIQSGMIPLPMYIFALMPYRHQSGIDTVSFVQAQVEQANGLMSQFDGMLKRFRKATSRRMAILQDHGRLIGIGTTAELSDDAILERFPFAADMSTANKHPVLRTMQTFLKEQDSKLDINTGNSSNPKTRKIIISLSGGVDSMVIASALAHLRRSLGYNLQLTAVHIDYANRPDSKAEASYVERYCQQLEIEYHVRRIEEVTRGVTNRDEYEKRTREVRYRLYRDTIQQARSEVDEEVGVMLGHHRGDLRENVLSNAHKGSGPLDLSGMTAVSINDGVIIHRPLLRLEKTVIFDYAHTFGVPYFKDTTPHWSTRGKLRNHLMPLLEEIYGEGSMNNLSNLAVESDDCRELVNTSTLKPFLDGLTLYPMGIRFKTACWKRNGLFFWKFVLRETLHSVGLGMFSDKSVASFLGRVQAETIREGWLQCRKDYAVYLQKNGHVYVFFPKSFPFRPSDAFKIPKDPVDFGGSNAVHVGPWRIRSELLNVQDKVKSLKEEKVLDRSAISSMDKFMEGCLEYYIEVPTWKTQTNHFEPRPLTFCKFGKESRPQAWKGIDAKIQDTIPLVGNDDQANQALKDPEAYGATHENKNGQKSINPIFVAKVTIHLENLQSNRSERYS